MANIEKGMEIELKYLDSKKKGLEFSLAEAMKTAGYDDLSQYFDEKRKFQLQDYKMNIRYAPIEEAISTLYNMINSQQTGLLIVLSDKRFVYHGTEPYDESFCKENGIIVHEVGHQGGNIVGSEKDLSLGLMFPRNIDIDSNWILHKYAQSFQKLNLPVVVDNNDLLLNNTKILGSAVIEKGNLRIHVCNISFGDSSELVSKICKVPRIKQPGKIPEGISRKDFVKEVLSCLT